MTEQQAREFMDALGAEIAYWRKRRGMTREQLAALVGVSATTLGRIERGDESAAASAATVWRIATRLGLQFSDMVSRAEGAAALSDPTPSLGAVASPEKQVEGAGEDSI